MDDIVEIALATRPDCINETYLKELDDLLATNAPEMNLTVELGLQTVNYHTLQGINRGHTLAEFIDAVLSAQKYGAEVTVHLILNLPGDNRVDCIEAAKILSALGVDTIKLHALYIRENSTFGELYKKGKLTPISREEYVERVILFLEHLSPEIAVQRLLGRAPREKSLFVNWGVSWWEIKQEIEEKLKKRNTCQGKKYNYLQGKALDIFSK